MGVLCTLRMNSCGQIASANCFHALSPSPSSHSSDVNTERFSVVFDLPSFDSLIHCPETPHCPTHSVRRPRPLPSACPSSYSIAH